MKSFIFNWFLRAVFLFVTPCLGMQKPVLNQAPAQKQPTSARAFSALPHPLLTGAEAVFSLLMREK